MIGDYTLSEPEKCNFPKKYFPVPKLILSRRRELGEEAEVVFEE